MSTGNDIQDIYKNLIGTLREAPLVSDWDGNAITLGQNLMNNLNVLEDLDIYNFRRDSKYRQDLNFQKTTEVASIRINVEKYSRSGIEELISHLAHKQDPSAFRYFLYYHEDIFENSSGLKNSLAEANLHLASIDEDKKSIRSLLEKAETEQSKIFEFSNSIDANITKVSNLEKTVEELNAKTVILEGIKNFEEISVVYKNRATRWIVTGGLTICALILFTTSKLFDYSIFSDIASSISTISTNNFSQETLSNVLYIAYAKSILANFLIMSILLYVISASVKNYKANMHNHVVCKHKAASLDAAKKLINTTISIEVHQFILASAANTIFSHQFTGYSNEKGESDNSANYALLNKLLDSVTPKSVSKV